MLDPIKYAVSDINGWYALYGKEKKSWSTNDFIIYIAKVRELCSKCSMTAREVDKALFMKGKRRKNRVNQLIHHLSKMVVKKAKETNSAIIFEDIRRIRQLYQRGNYQGRAYRDRMNGWSFAEIKRQIEYKAAWEGVPVIQLSVKETRGTSQLCPRCGKKITQVDRRTRQLWCDYCKRWMDRDVVGAMNLSIKGLARFASSKGLAGEAMKGNLERDPIILRVDASKLSLRKKS